MKPTLQPYIYWEDFCNFVIEAGTPYTERDVNEVLQHYGQGLQDSGMPTAKAEKMMGQVAKEMTKAGKKSNNVPTKY